MKKITALVLVLIMTLSLLPMSVWAAGESGGELQEQRNNIATPTDYKQLYMQKAEYVTEHKYAPSVGNNGVDWLNLFVGDGESKTQISKNTYTLSTSNNIGSFSFVENSESVAWVATPTDALDTEGYLEAKNGNTVYRMKFLTDTGSTVFTYHGVGIYTAYDNGVLGYGDWHYDDLTLTINGGNGISMLVPYIGDAETATAYLQPAAGLRLVLPEWRQNYTTLSSADSNGVYVLTNNDLSRNTSVQVFDGEQLVGEIDLMFVPYDGNSDGEQGVNEEIKRSNTPVVPGDILPLSAIPEDLDHTDFLGIVPVPGTEYYMNLIRHESGNLLGMKWDGNGLSQGAQVDLQLAIGFWKRDGQQMKLVEGAELTTLLGKFTNFKIELKLFTDDVDNTQGIEYPWTRDLREERENVTSQYPCCTEYVFNHYSQGKWLLVASGTYNGTTDVVTRAYTNKEEQLVEVIDATSMTTVTEINGAISNCIARLPEGYNGRIAVELPAATLEGYIEVPAFDNEVMLNGKMEGGELKTVLKGGIIVNSADFHAGEIRFIGAGRASSTTDNYAISGTARGGYSNCTFTGYDCAVYITQGLAGGENNFFYDNNVGIRVKDPDGLAVGNHQIYKTVFAYNGKDVEVLNADGENGDTKHYAIWDTIFIGSEKNVSVDESLWEILFMPKNAFDDGPLAADTSRVDEPKIEGRVSATPYYGLSDAGKDALYGLQDANADQNADYYLAHPTFNDDWIDHGRKFNSEWMCPEHPDKDIYNVPGDEIRKHHNRGHNMTIKVMGEGDKGHEHMATITLKKAD